MKLLTTTLASLLVWAFLTSVAMPQAGGEAERDKPPRRSGGDRAASAEMPPTAKDEAEQKILSVLDEMSKTRGIGVPFADGRMLRLLTEAVDAKQVVEIGTYHGHSAIWFCLALRKTGGKLTTHEYNASIAAIARENFKRAGVDQMITIVEGDAHQEVTKLKGPIDVLFIDADKEGYIDYLNKLLPLVRPGGLILAHNVPSTAPDYVKAVTSSPDLETVFYGRNLGVTMKKR